MKYLPSIISAAALAGGCVSSASLEGAWRSDPERTHAELRKVEDRLSEQQKDVLFADGFFGQLINVYSNGRAVTVYEGVCHGLTRYRVVSRTPRSLLVQGSLDGEPLYVVRFIIEADAYSIPLMHGAREVFVRVDMDEIAREYPCILELLGQ
jgi:hypothetical protein